MKWIDKKLTMYKYDENVVKGFLVQKVSGMYTLCKRQFTDINTFTNCLEYN